MKTNHLFFLVTLVLLASCHQEEPVADIQQQDVIENWKKASPEETFKKAENGFSISKQAIKQALELPEVTTIRFVLEVDNDVLQIRVVGADQYGNTSKGMLAKPISLEKTINKLFSEKEKHFDTTPFSKAVSSHIMQPEDAAVFISRWQDQWRDKSLEETIAYHGMRIEHFSMPAAVGEQILQSGSKNVNLVWGVNPQGKFTTVFLPELDEEGKLLKPGSFIYEYLTPCPPTCPTKPPTRS
ncbi:hypothetical protein [Aquimarina sp. MMG016]|uniref:hypothetical protein n=1 Tax=Aquimarina sp. MMG016 TaxID=2822690 RepID=UPI001B3A361A|nr:hypothetical protein [Aquimarina sp. MMG016]MBQ4819896.1 hypothetical protein [Aquimarina sp. MMG016]